MLKLLCILITSQIIFAKPFNSHFNNTFLGSNSGIWIKTDENNEYVKKSGETTDISGEICRVSNKAFKSKPTCLGISDQNLELTFYFPDFTTEVTEDVILNTHKSKVSFSYKTPELGINSPNTFVVMAGYKNPRIKKLLKTQAKLEKRLPYIDKLIEKAKGKNVKSHFIAGLEKLRLLIAKTITNIKEKILKESEVIAEHRIPIKVDNETTSERYYSSIIGDFKIQYTVQEGVPVQGDDVKINTSISNLVERRNNGDSFKVEIIHGSETVKTFDKVVIPDNESLSYDFVVDDIEGDVVNDLQIKLYKYTKFFNIKSLYGRLEDTYTSASDNLAPVLTLNQTDSNIIIGVEDKFGSIDKSTLTSTLINESNSIDVSDKLEVIELSDSLYSINFPLSEVSADGIYSFRINISDKAGNSNSSTLDFVIDRTPPIISILTSDNQLINNPSFEIPIAIEDISDITLNITQNGVIVDQINNKSYTFEPNLNEGINNFEFQAVDSLGNLSEKITLENIILDTISPSFQQISISDGDIYYTTSIPISGTLSEEIKSLKLNGIEVSLTNFNRSFNTTLNAPIEGLNSFKLEAIDLANNTTVIEGSIEVILRLINKDLVEIFPDGQNPNKLIVRGHIGSSREGVEITVNGGFFNTDTTVARNDGSFEAYIDFTSSVTIEATDSSLNKSESVVISYDIDTTLAGIIKDNDNNPLPGVVVSIASSGQSTVTDASGAFSIMDPITGDQELIIDPTTIPIEVKGNNREFSKTTYAISIGLTQSNVIERTIFLTPKLIDGSETQVVANTATTVTSTHAPGVELSIPANTAIFPDGSNVGAINIMEISKDRTTLPPPEFAEPDTVYAFEPSGLKFSEPVEIVLPNDNEFPEGTELIILSKNSSTGKWEADGAATVENGVVRSKEGMGITHFSDIYAAPLAPTITELGAEHIRGANTFENAMSTSISLPTYKVMGEDFGTGLVYKSTWAKPSVTVTNIFSKPNYFIERNSSKLIQKSEYRTLAEINDQIWITPEEIRAQFYSSNFNGEQVVIDGSSYKGDNAVVSFAHDLSSLSSGIYPYATNYEIRLKKMIIRTIKATSTLRYKNQYLDEDGRRTLVQKLKPKTINFDAESFFPEDLIGLNHVLNKKDSPYGKGWDVQGVQKIVNPNSPRIMIDEGNGGFSSYYFNDKIETVVDRSDSLIRAVNLDRWPSVELINNDRSHEIFDFSSGINSSSISSNTIPSIKGKIAKNLFWKRPDICGNNCGLCDSHHVEVDMMVNPANFVTFDNGHTFIGDKYSNIYRLLPDSDLTAMTNSFKSMPRVDTNTSELEIIDDRVAQIVGSVCNTLQSNGITDNCWAGRITNRKREGVTYNFPSAANNIAVGGTITTSLYERGDDACIADRIGSVGAYPVRDFQDGNLSTAKTNEIKDLVINSKNEVIFADYGNNIVRKINFEGADSVTTIAGNRKTGLNTRSDYYGSNLATQVKLEHPTAVTVDALDNVYVAVEKGFVFKIDGSTGNITIVAGQSLNGGGVIETVAPALDMNLDNPSGLVFDNDNNYLYVSDTGHKRVLRIDMGTKIASTVAGNFSSQCASDGNIGDGGPALNASVCSPTDLGLDDNNNLLIFDRSQNRIRRVLFSNTSLGELSYTNLNHDNSTLTRNSDGSFERSFRNGNTVYFDKDGFQISQVDRNGNAVIYEYEDDKISKIIDPKGGITQYQYNGDLLAQIIDPTDRITSFVYDDRKLIEVIYPDSSSMKYEYDNNDFITKAIDQRNNETQYVYNQWRKLEKTIDASGEIIELNDLKSKTTVNNNTDTDKAELISLGDEAAFDGIKDAKGYETIFDKDINGFISTITDAKGRITTVTRNIKGDPLKITRDDGTYTEFTYDEDNFDLLSTYDSGSNTTQSQTYDNYGNILTKTDVDGRVTTYEYDSSGNVKKITDNEGDFVEYSYNEDGQILTTKNQLGFIVTNDYNEITGNLVASISNAGNVIEYTRDISGNVIKKTDQNGKFSEYAFDLFNRLLEVKSNRGDITSYEYLSTGELAKIIDPLNGETLFSYNSLGQLVRKDTPEGNIYTMSYDGNGNIEKVVDPNGNETQYEYDSLNRLVKKIMIDDEYHMDYDVRDNIEYIKNKNSEITYTYERTPSGDMVSSIQISGLNEVAQFPSSLLEFDYNSEGQRELMVTPFGSYQYAYDEKNRLSAVLNPKGEEFQFDYDKSNRLVAVAYPNFESELVYDTENFLKSITYKDNTTTLSMLEFFKDNAGNITKKRAPAGDFDYTFDDDYQVLTASNPEVAGENETYTYDPLGNRVTDKDGAYVYDTKKQRLIEDWKYFYQFDNNGNLVNKQEKGLSGNVEIFNYSSSNQLIGIEYYTSNVKTKELKFAYDALGRRMSKEYVDVSDSTKSYKRMYLYDGESIIAEYDGDGNRLTEYTHSGLAMDDVLSVNVTEKGKDVGIAPAAQSYYYLKDHLGSVTNIVNKDNSLIQHYSYSSFGKILKIADQLNIDVKASPVVKTLYAFTGREYDFESGLYHYRARVYSPDIGRFLQVDPDSGRLQKPNTFNSKYVYVGNNPQKFIDPTGEFGIVAGLIIVGAVVGAATNAKALSDSAIKFSFLDYAEAVLVGAALGGANVAASAINPFLGVIISGATGYLNAGYLSKKITGRWDNDFAVAGGVDGLFSGLAGAATGFSAVWTEKGSFVLGFTLGQVFSTPKTLHSNNEYNNKNNSQIQDCQNYETRTSFCNNINWSNQ